MKSELGKGLQLTSLANIDWLYSYGNVSEIEDGIVAIKPSS